VRNELAQLVAFEQRKGVFDVSSERRSHFLLGVQADRRAGYG